MSGLCDGAERQRRWLGLLSCFACGVFLATCLLDLLPDYLEGMTQACNTAGLKVRRPTPSPASPTPSPVAPPPHL